MTIEKEKLKQQVHDLNNALGVINGIAHVLVHKLDGQDKDLMEKIHQAADKAEKISNDIFSDHIES